MAGALGHNWGAIIGAVYAAAAALASCLLAPSLLTRSAADVSQQDGVVAAIRHQAGVAFVAIGLFIVFAGVGLILVVIATSFLDSIGRDVRARKRRRREARRCVQASARAARPTGGGTEEAAETDAASDPP